MILTVALYVLAAIFVLDALRMRARVGKLPVLAQTDDAPTHDVISAPGVTVADTTRRAASAYMRAHQLDVLDLIPRDLDAVGAMSLAQLLDPEKYRDDRLATGRTAGHAVVVTPDVAQRAHITPPTDDLAFTRLAVRLKHFGAGDLAIAPDERAHRIAISARFAQLRAMLGPMTSIALAGLPIVLALLALGIVARPVPGIVAAAAWQAQPLVALAGTRLGTLDVIPATLFRAPLELLLLARTLLFRASDDTATRAAEYDRAIAGGLDRFYEPRRETCPLCDSRELVVHLKNRDLLQHKPGTFTLERCTACGHVFQNPRLSLAGLDFYYKDFYDGLGEAGMEFVFGFGAEPYLNRARMVANRSAPKRWLDVGCGHGHFCVAARKELPDTTFDGLDLSESIDEAKRRGWVDTGYRGLFPELAPELAGRYDAVSMSHYLEHTLDPRAELAAAHTALAPRGALLIEVPDPEFWLGRWLGRYWLPWFQPQHLNLLSVANLERLLRERGFDPVEWHRGKAHQRVDFFFATYLLLDRIAPSPRLPWRRRGALASGWRVLVWTAGTPLLLASTFFDNAIGPLLSKARVSNTYRVLAVKSDAST